MAAILLRLPDELHDLARVAAALRRKSVNAYILEAVRMHVVRMARGQHGAPLRAALEGEGVPETRRA